MQITIKWSFFLFMVAYTLLNAGCTEAIPQIDLLSTDLAKLTFSENSLTAASKTIIPVGGDVNIWKQNESISFICDDHGKSFEIKFSESEEWQSLSESQITCVNDKATLNLTPDLLGSNGFNKLAGLSNSNNRLTLFLRNSLTVKNNKLSSSVATIELIFDFSAGLPVVTVSTASNYINSYTVASYTISGTCSENGQNVLLSGDITATVACNSGAWNLTQDMTWLPEGTVSIAVDHAAISGTPAPQQLLTLTKDTEVPTAVINSAPVGTNNTTALNVSISGPSDIAFYRYIVGNSLSTDCSMIGLIQTSVAIPITDTLSFNDGTVLLCVLGVDSAGNVQSVFSGTTATWTKDTTGPSVSIGTLSSAIGNSSTSFTATVSYTDASSINLQSTDIQISGSGISCSTKSVTNGNSNPATITFTGCIGNGPLTVSINAGTAQDTLGNLATASNTTQTQLDNQVPGEPTLNIPAGANGNTLPTVDVTNITSGDRVKLYLNAACSDYISTEHNATGTSISIPVSPIPLGQNSIYARITDPAGNSICSTNSVSYNYYQSISVTAAFNSGKNWNDYIDNNGGSLSSQSDSTCSLPANKTYNEGCRHGGEIRKATVSNLTTCTNIYALDDLRLFDWVCELSGGVASIYSTNLKKGKGLRDLLHVNVDNSVSWKQNKLTVYNGNDDLVAESSVSTWGWENTLYDLIAVTPLDAILSISLNAGDVNPIYYATGDVTTDGFFINYDKTSVVTLNNSSVIYSGASANNCNGGDGNIGNNLRSVIFGPAHKFIWIEADIKGGAGVYRANSAIFGASWTYSRINNVKITDMFNSSIYYPIHFNSSNSLKMTNTRIDKGGTGLSGGLALDGSSSFNVIESFFATRSDGPLSFIFTYSTASNNRFSGVRLASHNYYGSYGVELYGSNNVLLDFYISNMFGGIYLSGNNNIIAKLLTSNVGNSGLTIDNSNSNIITHFTSTNSSASGMDFAGSAINGNIINSALIAGNATGIDFIYGSSGDGNLFYNIASANNSMDINATYGSYATFDGYLMAGGCTIGANITDSACSRSTNAAISADATSAFVGKIGSISNFTDLNNGDSWTIFASPYRAWGPDTAANFPDPSNQGKCSSGTCQVWDWRLNNSSPFTNKSADGQSDNSLYISDSANHTCANFINGDDYIFLSYGGVSIEFMKNALEISGDKIGNENGLCEAGEKCLYTPNIGAYQGHGDIPNDYCVTTGYLSHVTLYMYPNIGM